jgi:hypothetical protein
MIDIARKLQLKQALSFQFINEIVSVNLSRQDEHRRVHSRLCDSHPFVSGVYAGDPDELAMAAALKKVHLLEGLDNLGPGLEWANGHIA